MEVLTAKTAGFCFGVRRAVNKVSDLIDEKKSGVMTYGPVVHNDSVIQKLTEKGVVTLNEEIDPSIIQGSIVVIRAHGVSEETESALKDAGAQIVDMTCPFVKKIHGIVEENSRLGRWVIIVGDPHHPEVIGIRGWVNGRCFIVNSIEDAENLALPSDMPVCIVSQTTNNEKKFNKIVEKIVEKNAIQGYNRCIVNTICNATRERQSEAADIASKVEVMLVIGGRNSSNSQKLYDICNTFCSHTYFIQTVDDLEEAWFRHVKCVGITAGASTPERIIEEVQTYVRKF